MDRTKSVVVVPEPALPQRVALSIFGILWVVFLLAIPLRYYLGDDPYDERFAWRMFSAVRVQQCTLALSEVRDGREHQLAPMEILPVPWVALLERNRPAVIERFLRWRCEREGTSEVRFRNTCRDASGDPLPPIERTMTCASGRIEARGVSEGAEERGAP
jgi:hypothetical protein